MMCWPAPLGSPISQTKIPPMKTVSLQSNSLKVAFAGLLGAAAIISAPGQAQAANPIAIVTPPGIAGVYQITYQTGTYASLATQLATNPWWGNSSFASQAPVLLGATKVPVGPNPLLTPDLTNQLVATFVPQSLGYLFAYSVAGSFGGPVVNFGATTAASGNLTGITDQILVSDTNTYSWAFGKCVGGPCLPSAVPGPLPIVGAAAAFGFSRRVRSRINKSATV